MIQKNAVHQREQLLVGLKFLYLQLSHRNAIILVFQFLHPVNILLRRLDLMAHHQNDALMGDMAERIDIRKDRNRINLNENLGFRIQHIHSHAVYDIESENLRSAVQTPRRSKLRIDKKIFLLRHNGIGAYLHLVIK